MRDEIFNSNQTLEEICNLLTEHIKEESYIQVKGDGSVNLYIRENGWSSFWFRDLVEVILKKVEQRDKEIVDICIHNNIDVFEVKRKRS